VFTPVFTESLVVGVFEGAFETVVVGAGFTLFPLLVPDALVCKGSFPPDGFLLWFAASAIDTQMIATTRIAAPI
jgi:hypothetical protein